MHSLLPFAVVVLAPAIASGEALKAVVKDSSDTPLAGAMVLIHWDRAGNTVGLKSNVGIEADLSVQTKDDGTFTADLPPGFYDIFVAATAFTPASRKIRMKVAEAQEITFHLDVDPLHTAEMGNRVVVVDGFAPVTPGYVPEGTATLRGGVAIAEECESACASTLACKAYAFDTAKHACYFYSKVGETRTPKVYSSGLPILPKIGFISAFKRSSFPPDPFPLQPPK